MFEPIEDPIADEELTGILRAALRTGSGGLSRAAECHMAAIVAEHLVERLAIAGVRAVRVGGSQAVKQGLLF